MEGLIYEGKFAFQIRFASLIVGSKFTFLLCLSLYLRAISKYKAPVGAYIWRGDLTEAFLLYEFWGAYIWRGLYVEALIFGILRYRVFFRSSVVPGRGYSTKFYTGRFRPEVQALTLFCYIDTSVLLEIYHS